MIHLECDNDEAVVRGLGFSRGEISHHAGKPRVAFALQKATSADHTGMVDQDPGQSPPTYLAQFKLVEVSNKDGLALWVHPKEEKRLIEIRPDLEPWLYASGKLAGVKPESCHLPADHRLLHQNAKRHTKHLVEFVHALLAAGSSRVLLLQQWLQG